VEGGNSGEAALQGADMGRNQGGAVPNQAGHGPNNIRADG